MTRGLRAWNRVAAILVGLCLLAVGAAGVFWWRGDLTRWWPDAPERLDVAGVTEPTVSWWPWTVLIVGAALTLLALFWLIAHLRTTRAGSVRLAGSDVSGSLTLTTGSAVDHLGRLVRTLPRVTGYRASVVRERGRLVLVAKVRVTPDADLPVIADRLTALTAEFVSAASLPDLGVRLRIQVTRQSGRPRREVA